jgi:hypothetical protein
MKIKTAFVNNNGVRIPKIMTDYPDKITSYSACDINDETVYDINTDQITLDAIAANPDYEVIE